MARESGPHSGFVTVTAPGPAIYDIDREYNMFFRPEAHGFLRIGPQLDFYRRLERFLDWYLL